MPLTRREFLFRSGGGLGGIALAAMLGRENLLAAETSDATGGVLHFPPKAKRVVQLFMAGAASHVDMWDHKPELARKAVLDDLLYAESLLHRHIGSLEKHRPKKTSKDEGFSVSFKRTTKAASAAGS